jgi:hypothetical protein
MVTVCDHGKRTSSSQSACQKQMSHPNAIKLAVYLSNLTGLVHGSTPKNIAAPRGWPSPLTVSITSAAFQLHGTAQFPLLA